MSGSLDGGLGGQHEASGGIEELVVGVGCERMKDKLARWFLLSARGWI